jgi:hypothetical protein
MQKLGGRPLGRRDDDGSLGAEIEHETVQRGKALHPARWRIL